MYNLTTPIKNKKTIKFYMTITSEIPELLTIKEAAQLIHVHPNTLRNWEREGKIQAVRIGSRRDRRYQKEIIWQLCQIAAPSLA